MAAVTTYHGLGGLKQQIFIYSSVLEAGSMKSGVSRAILLLKELAGKPSSPLPSLWWLMQFLGIPCPVARCSAPISASVFVCFISVSVSVPPHLLLGAPVIGFRAHPEYNTIAS